MKTFISLCRIGKDHKSFNYRIIDSYLKLFSLEHIEFAKNAKNKS